MTTEFPSYERVMTAKALLLLTQAADLGIKVGTDGRNLITVSRSPVPLELSRRLHTELCKHRTDVIEIIKNQGGCA
jgi:hypothetical protein